MLKIPPSLIGTAAPALAQAFTHSGLNSLFPAYGFPGDPPEGNKQDKCLAWLRRANSGMLDPLRAFGALIGEFMDNDDWADMYAEERAKIVNAFAAERLTYQRGGIILGVTLAGPSISLAENLKAHGSEALTREYERAYAAIESDPPAAVTAACAILESLARIDPMLPLKPQLDAIEGYIKRWLSENIIVRGLLLSPEKKPSARAWTELWPGYLRLLDARDPLRKGGPVSYFEIAKVIDPALADKLERVGDDERSVLRENARLKFKKLCDRAAGPQKQFIDGAFW